MKTFLIAAFIFAAPAAAFAQSTPADSDAPRSKVNVAVRDDMAQAENMAETHNPTISTARSARVGGKTIRLIDGSLPTDIQTANAELATPGS